MFCVTNVPLVAYGHCLFQCPFFELLLTLAVITAVLKVMVEGRSDRLTQTIHQHLLRSCRVCDDTDMLKSDVHENVGKIYVKYLEL
jgi:hypothetical protein